jgi:hypothetical protein
MEQALVGLVGLLIGILLTEYFRRRSRVEMYSSKVFERRLDAYEGLMTIMTEAGSAVGEVLGDESMPLEERRGKVVEAGLRVSRYMDEHLFYLNDEIMIHCGVTFVGVVDVLDLAEGKKREDAIDRFLGRLKNARDMIRAESGMSEIDRAFRAVTKAKHSGPVIDEYRRLKVKHEQRRAKKQV